MANTMVLWIAVALVLCTLTQYFVNSMIPSISSYVELTVCTFLSENLPVNTHVRYLLIYGCAQKIYLNPLLFQKPCKGILGRIFE